MESTRRARPTHPRETASCLSFLFFTWTWSLFRQDAKKRFNYESIWGPVSSHTSLQLADRLERSWRGEVRRAAVGGGTPSLMLALVKTFAKELSLLAFIHISVQLLDILLRPYLLKIMLSNFSPEGSKEGIVTAALGLVATTCVTTLVSNHYNVMSFNLGVLFKAASVALVYRKSLRLSRGALGETSPGHIVNLVSNDVSRFEIVCLLVNFMWSAPLVAAIVGYFLYLEVGLAGIAGLLVVFTVAPIQSYTGKLTSRFRLQTALKTDERIRRMDEVLSGIEVIKMYAWERPFIKILETTRKNELGVIKKSGLLRGLYMCFNVFTTRCAVASTLITYSLMGNPLRADKVFVVAAYFGIMSMSLSSMFVRGFAELAECRVSIRRLQKFMLMEEVQIPSIKEYSGNNVYENLGFEREEEVNESGAKDQTSKDGITDKVKRRGFAEPDDVKDKRRDEVEGAAIKDGNEDKMAEVKREENQLGGIIEEGVKSEEVREVVVERSPSGRTKPEVEEAVKVCNKPRRLSSQERRLSLERYLRPRVEEGWVCLEGAAASWSGHTVLSAITLTAGPGRLLGLIGPVGAGKSSLLQLLLGEMTVTEGEVSVRGRVSYASQEPWVFAATVRQNILFGLPLDRRRYKEVVKACCLERDLELLPNGDQTVVGERGSSLSGGQRARLNLARAVYRRADIYLLDDPLSAVDSHVCKHIFKNCLRGFLRGKTVILATHQLQFMKNMDHIICLENGRIKQSGNYEEVMKQGCELAQSEVPPSGKDTELHAGRPTLDRMISVTSVRSSRSSIGDDISLCSDVEIEPDAEQINPETTTKFKGSPTWGFLRSGAGILQLLVILFLFLLTQLLASSTDFWVSYWTKNEEMYAINMTSYSESDNLGGVPDWYKVVYGGLVVGLFVAALCRGLSFYLTCNQCSGAIHTSMVNSVFNSPMSFFNKNPQGGILNRFSKDLGGADEALPKALLDCGQIFGQAAGAMITSAIINPWFLIPIGVFASITLIIRNYCVKSTKNMKRIENMARSPVYSHLNASLQGLVTIRALKAQPFLREEFDAHQDTHTSSMYTYFALQQGYAFGLDVFGLTYLTIVVLSFVYFTNDAFGAEVGLAITQTITVTSMLQWGMRQSSELSNLMTSVERLLSFTNLPPEETDKGNKLVTANNWPSFGHIELKGVSLWYDKTDPPIIDNVSITIFMGEKVGIVGRTGAGKSSLIAALFRLAQVEGCLLIDGVDTARLPLATLRSRLSIIPQNPVLFSGTIRGNLDPFGDYPDYKLWDALDQVELKEVLKEGQGLESRVTDTGSNLSVGQRQLVCLARAVVRENRIIVMDEATANVDPKTDQLIQETIRRRFGSCTVLTVAHRLQTVIDCDRILVMDAGRPVEFDEPHVLLQRESGYFYHLVHESGKAMAAHLTETAQQVHMRKQHSSLEE